MTPDPTVQSEQRPATRLKLVTMQTSEEDELLFSLPVVIAGQLEFEISHSMPGRLRLKVPGIRSNIEFEQRVQGAVSVIPGVLSVRTNRLAASVIVEYAAEKLSQDELVAAFEATDLNTILPVPHKLLHASSIATTLERMLILFQQSTPPVVQFAASAAAMTAAMLGAPFAPALCCVSGLPILCRATQTAVRERRISVDGLDGMAAILMMTNGQLRAASFMMTLIGLGEYIRELTANRCQKIVDDLLGMAGASTWLVKGQKRICIPADQVKIAETVVVYPGDMIPVDGVVIRGEGLVNQASLTGEAIPVDVCTGSSVFAATVLQHGQIYVNCTAPLNKSRAQNVIDLVNTAPISETKIQNYAATMADKAVMPIIGSSLVSLVMTRDVTRMMSMLIYDFSTGIRISAPTAVLASMAHAGKLGILIKSGGALERLAKVDAIVFDKTGTLTSGNPHVTDVFTTNGYAQNDLISLAAAVESRLSHPAAQAIVAYANKLKLILPHRTEASHSVGMGVGASVDGKHVLVGSRRFMETKKISVERAMEYESDAITRGVSLAYIAIDGVLSGIVAYADAIRPEAAETIKKMHRRGVKKVVMATGDVEASARRIAAQIGVDEVVSGAFPENKAKLVQDLKAQGFTVAVVGDGINDSPALAHADVAISLRGGTHAAREHSDVVLTDDNLLRVAQAIDIARGSMQLIHETMALVVVANGAGLALTAAGVVGPAGATLLNNGSAILAAINSLRPLMAPSWSKEKKLRLQ
jgi:heavy metal translocating P-type ATPase